MRLQAGLLQATLLQGDPCRKAIEFCPKEPGFPVDDKGKQGGQRKDYEKVQARSISRLFQFVQSGFRLSQMFHSLPALEFTRRLNNCLPLSLSGNFRGDGYNRLLISRDYYRFILPRICYGRQVCQIIWCYPRRRDTAAGDVGARRVRSRRFTVTPSPAALEPILSSSSDRAARSWLSPSCSAIPSLVLLAARALEHRLLQPALVGDVEQDVDARLAVSPMHLRWTSRRPPFAGITGGVPLDAVRGVADMEREVGAKE